MWARKRIDITWIELLSAFGFCFSTNRCAVESATHLADHFGGEQALLCLSVRSGFDLALQAFDWPADSEIIFSGYTIPDMPRIAAAHGYHPVAVDVDWRTMTPTASGIESAINQNTRAIVVAHLFGGRCELEPVIALARKHNLILIEDCAQAYIGNHYQGTTECDVSMFSFGPIKTNTALGGAMLIVRNPNVLAEMNARQEAWPKQPQIEFANRVAKYSFVKIISSWHLAALIRIGFMLLGSSHDQFAATMARSFKGDDFFAKIRRQPSRALTRLLSNKIRRFDIEKIQRRRRLGNRLSRLLCEGNAELPFAGIASIDPTHWVFAVLVKDPESLVKLLWRHGFDATTQSSLRPISSRLEDLPMIDTIHRQIVFLPLNTKMPAAEIDRLGKLINSTDVQMPNFAQSNSRLKSNGKQGSTAGWQAN